MCKWRTNATIKVIRSPSAARLHLPDGWYPVAVDACIAAYVQRMNDLGIVTVGCCCGHGKGPGAVLVAAESAALMDALGYERHELEPGRDDVVEHTIPASGHEAVRRG